MARPRRLQPHPDKLDCQAPFHGDSNAYKNARPPCRCPDAREDTRVTKKRRKAGILAPSHVPSLGAARMMRALAALGHSGRAITAAGGARMHVVHRLQADFYPTVTADDDRACRRAYARLATRDGDSVQARNRAERGAWPRPDEWWPGELDDPAADPRATHAAQADDGDVAALVSAAKYRGLRLDSLTLADQERVVTALRREDGATLAAIAGLLGTDRAGVQRVVARITRRELRAAA